MAGAAADLATADDGLILNKYKRLARWRDSLSELLRYTPAMLSEAQALPEDPAQLREAAEGLVSLVKSQALRIAKLEHQLAGLRRHRFGSTSESLDQLQLSLEDEEIAAAQADKAVPPSDPTATPKGVPKRKPLPAHLPRQETLISPGDACAECGGRLKPLGEDVTEELDYVPVGLWSPASCAPSGLHLLRGYLPGALAVAAYRAGTPRSRPARPCAGRQIWRSLAALSAKPDLPSAKEIDLDRSTLADWVGKSTALPFSLARRDRAPRPGRGAVHSPTTRRAAGRRRATGKTRTARISGLSMDGPAVQGFWRSQANVSCRFYLVQ